MIKIDENWKKIMKETKGAWRRHLVFKEMDDAIEIVNWMRGKNEIKVYRAGKINKRNDYQ